MSILLNRVLFFCVYNKTKPCTLPILADEGDTVFVRNVLTEIRYQLRSMRGIWNVLLAYPEFLIRTEPMTDFSVSSIKIRNSCKQRSYEFPACCSFKIKKMKQLVFENPRIQDKVTVLEHPGQTNGTHLLLEVELKPGGGNALHYHTSFTEEFIPVSGILGVCLGDKKRHLLPGETAMVGIGERHFFFNDTKENIRFRVKISPAHDGFLQALQIAYGLAGDGLTNGKGIPKKIDHLAVLTQLSDTRVTGMLSLISGLLLRRAKKLDGLKRQLIETYCSV